jgi:hypothetical protein
MAEMMENIKVVMMVVMMVVYLVDLKVGEKVVTMA